MGTYITKKYSDILEYAKKSIPSQIYNFNKIDEHFDENTAEEVAFALNNQTTLTVKDWDDFYKKNQDCLVIKTLLTEIPTCPINIKLDIIKETLSLITPPFYSFDSCLELNILDNAMHIDLPYETFESIINADKNHFFYKLNNALADSYTDNIKPLSFSHSVCLNAARYILKHPEIIDDVNICAAIPSTQHEEILHNICHELFSHITDKEEIKDAINRILLLDGHTIIKTELYNHSLLDPSNKEDVLLMNSLFEDGIELSKIKHFEDNVLDYIFQNFIEFDDDKNSRISISSEILTTLLSCNNITPAIEYDLFKRLDNPKCEKDEKLSSLKLKILANTSHDELIKVALDLPLPEFENMLNETFNPKPFYYTNFMHKIIESMKNDFKGGDKSSRQQYHSLYNDLKTYCQKAPLLKEDYKFLFEEKPDSTGVLSCIAASPYTPTDVLNDMILHFTKINEKDPDPYMSSIIIIAKLNLTQKENIINENTLKTISNFIYINSYFCDKKVGSIEDFESSYEAHYFGDSPDIKSFEKIPIEELQALKTISPTLFQEVGKGKDNYLLYTLLGNVTEAIFNNSDNIENIDNISSNVLRKRLNKMLSNLSELYPSTQNSRHTLILYKAFPLVCKKYKVILDELKDRNIDLFPSLQTPVR